MTDPQPQPQPIPVVIQRGPVAKGIGFTLFVLAMAFCVLPAVGCAIMSVWTAITDH